MRFYIVIITLLLTMAACGDDARIYDDYTDFENGQWNVQQKPVFEFEIKDTLQRYNVYANIRNAVSYPESRFFFQYTLQDSLHVLNKKLEQLSLFDHKTGEPFGSSGLGDIYDHELLLLKDYSFKHRGMYRVTFEQYTRKDTLEGILAVGLRVEQAVKE